MSYQMEEKEQEEVEEEEEEEDEENNEILQFHEAILNHVVLPRVLPQAGSQQLEEHERALLSHIHNAVQDSKNWLPKTTVKLFDSFKLVHMIRTPEFVSSEINALKPGNTFAMFVRRQNCAFLLYMPEDENDIEPGEMKTVIVATFPGNFHPAEIYNHSSDLQFDYPLQALKVKFSKMMRSRAFAHQLCLLYDTVPVETIHRNRNYVDTWLTSVLSDENTSISDFPKITKKFRDEVVGKVSTNRSAIESKHKICRSNYFRRSSHYMATKAILQLSLTVELGAEKGKSVYKIVMLHFMTKLCDFFLSPQCKTLNIDLMSQLMAKIARRIEKLPEDVNNDVSASETIIQNAKYNISQLRVKIDRQIHNLQSKLVLNAQLKPLVGLNFEADVHQKVPKLREYLKKRSSLIDGNQSAYSDPLQMKLCYRHGLNELQPPPIDIFTKLNAEIEGNSVLTDFENWILYNVQIIQTQFECETLREWSFKYSAFAERFYADDQLGTSKMLLVRLKLVAMMDSIATIAHPLLLEHRTCIDVRVFDILLLPQSIDMKKAFELQKYFEQRNKIANDPGLVEETEISPRSFSVKFADRNPEMRRLKRTIIEESEKKYAHKYWEWEDGRKRVQALRKRAFRMICQCEYVDGKIVQNGPYCARCILEKNIKGVKIRQYHRPLPTCDKKRNSIVFELRIPNEIATLRDVLDLTTKFRQSCEFDQTLYDWTDDNRLSLHNLSRDRAVNSGRSKPVTLGLLHVDYSFGFFVVENVGQCVLNASGRMLCKAMAIEDIKKSCTLEVEAGSVYSKLQWTLNRTTHTQNKVLARQLECPQNLSLSEFKEFGSLRADGHRLQLRKLYAMIETESLSFDQSSVLSLVLQTIWETGVRGECGFVRESHDDFTDLKFSSTMINLLRKFLQKQSGNWDNPTKLMIVAFISVRVFEINDTEAVANQCAELLNELRNVLIEWIGKVENTLDKLKDRTGRREEELRLKLAYITITGAATFFVNPKHEFFDKIFTENTSNRYSAAQTWLKMIITLNNNIILSHHVRTQAESKLRMLLRLVRNIGIQIESKIRESIENHPDGVFQLIKERWNLAGRGTLVEHYFEPRCPQVCEFFIVIDGVKNRITIDLITGAFLVNYLPILRLPENITEQALFQRVFERYLLEVQPYSNNSFSTVRKYNGHSYEFGWSNTDLIITELRNNGIEMELIPPEVLDGELPELLVENFSHWWNEEKNIIEFRPKNFSDKLFSNELGISYEIDLTTGRLVETKTKRNMLDINSVSYKKIRNHLSRLERQKYIHVLMDEPKMAKIELVRMNLKFRIDCSQRKYGGYDMLSNEFCGMRVSLKQNCGTLYGLNRGLLLERTSDPDDQRDVKSSPELLIIPHSTVNSSCTRSHVEVDIDLDAELRTPPFHRYQVDPLLRQLRAINSSFSAWLYLAHLHAVTSHAEIEPLTRMSGTERALQILQSSFVWSTAPYDVEVIKTLQSIANLTPKRHLNQNIQSVQWPKTIPNRSAQDSFFFIAKKLIEDSQRLSGLHPEHGSVKSDLSFDSLKRLNIRDYSRCLQLTPNLRVREIFIELEVLRTKQPQSQNIIYSRNTLNISNLYHRNSYFKADDFDLKRFLMRFEYLHGPIHKRDVFQILNQTVCDAFENLWISLYNEARSQTLTEEQFSLIFSLYIHEHKEHRPILALQTIARNSHIFTNINPPNITEFKTCAGTYNAQEIEDLLRNAYSRGFGWNQSAQQYQNFMGLKSIIAHSWPCDSVNLSGYDESRNNFMNKLNREINQRLLIWNNNRKLFEFIEKVEEALRTISSTNLWPSSGMVINSSCLKEDWPKYEINFETKSIKKIDEFRKIWREAVSVWKMEAGKNSKRSADEWWTFYQQIVNSDDKKHLIEAGMYPRLVPSLVLPKIASDNRNWKLKPIIGAWALSIAREQRLKRIETYEKLPHSSASLDREIENEPHTNWRPCDYPQWLLFEIEQNLTIRRIQIEIAKRMIDPPEVNGKKNSVMQLNMGEGKTSVIVPILAAALADGKTACQITVLKSLFATNLKSLRQYLGGMLDRRIYTFPCRRDMPITQYVKNIQKIYEECQDLKGVILTLPEHRLSFQLKIYESVQKADISAAKDILAAQNWINANVRNILDESDAILHAKYQLVYTIGNQLPLDGGAKRFLTIQEILKRVPHHMRSLYEKYGEEKIEIDGQVYRPYVFTPCRILDELIFTEIKNLLIDDFITGQLNVGFPGITSNIRDNVKQFLSEKEVTTEVCERVLNNFGMTERNILMTLSGLLRFEVLKLVLMKRWRVNYGVNEEGSRKMAIPFKAKDVPAEMTEFGHPDVALCFTQLSYYYSGLTDDQLMRVFEILKRNQNAAEIYEKWMNNVPAELTELSIKAYSGVNLSDLNQRDHQLFPLLRFNMYVIDYWLSTDVYPREAKTFEKKLTCTAWDLCNEDTKHVITGFSGTNDTKNILPLPIVQNDLQELEKTNENVHQILLQEEVKTYEKLPANISGKEILKRLVQECIPVLLDSGALILELSNVEVAEEWLKMASESRSQQFDAAVYFDRNDVLQTIDRNGVVAEFDCSVYRENLQRCLVYLDDVHTRGTDLKFPLDWKACVTLSGDITRDKTVQACMRMRHLDRGHSIVFWASNEADFRIRSTCNLQAGDSITNEHVIKFVCANSKRSEKENTVHWAAAAHNYAKKLAAHKLHNESLEELYEKCADEEFTTLKNMYGDEEEMLVVDLSQIKFSKLAQIYRERESIAEFVERVGTAVVDKVKVQAVDVKRFKHVLDEEHEKELEHELEELREVERPPQVIPATPKFNENLIELFMTGSSDLFSELWLEKEIIPLSLSLSSTKLFAEYYNEEPWDRNLLITEDCMRVVKGFERGCDDFLRPVWWIACITIPNDWDYYILLSSFECDRLISTFKKSESSTLCMYRPRLSKLQSNLLRDTNLQVTAMEIPFDIGLDPEIQIGVYAGSMYFKSDDEQSAYCGFLGLIPRPRLKELEEAFDDNIIKPNGFVEHDHRNSTEVISKFVGQCQFIKNPIDLVHRLISAHHQFMRDESHVATILDRGMKTNINNDK